MSNISSNISISFHLITLVHHIYASYILTTFDPAVTSDPIAKNMIRFCCRYITGWNMIIQTIYLSLALISDLGRLSPENKIKQKYLTIVDTLKGYIFNIYVFPLAIYVAGWFWLMFSINREWVAPKSIDYFTPKWANHAVHSNIVIVVIVELLLAKKDFPRPRFFVAFQLLAALSLIYFTQFFTTYFKYQFWLYGIFNELNLQGKIFFVFVTQLSGIGFLKLGYVIQNYKSKKAHVN